MIFIECEQGSEEWLAARAGVCTASNFKIATTMVNLPTDQQQAYINAMLAGMTEKEAMLAAGYKSKPRSDTIDRALAGLPVGDLNDTGKAYAARKAVERICGTPLDENFQTWAMRRGQEQEPHGRRAYEARTGNMAMEAGICLTDDRLFGYSTDGLVEDDGLIEIKSLVAPLAMIQMWDTGDMSDYMHQMQGGMWITGRLWCDFVMWCPQLESVGKDLFVQRVLRDDDFIERMEPGLIAFEARVQDNLRILQKRAA